MVSKFYGEFTHCFDDMITQLLKFTIHFLFYPSDHISLMPNFASLKLNQIK